MEKSPEILIFKYIYCFFSQFIFMFSHIAGCIFKSPPRMSRKYFSFFLLLSGLQFADMHKRFIQSGGCDQKK